MMTVGDILDILRDQPRDEKVHGLGPDGTQLEIEEVDLNPGEGWVVLRLGHRRDD